MKWNLLGKLFKKKAYYDVSLIKIWQKINNIVVKKYFLRESSKFWSIQLKDFHLVLWFFKKIDINKRILQ